MTREKDTQRSALYAWERALIGMPDRTREMTLDECAALVARVWSEYRPGDEPPRITDGRGARIARGARYSLKLPRWARRPGTVLHETAHSLMPRDGEAAHGPEFATLLLDLLTRYVGIDRAAARKAGIEQRPRRVHFAPAAKVPQRRSREYMRWHARVVEARKAYAQARATYDAIQRERPAR